MRALGALAEQARELVIKREKVASASGELLGAALNLVVQLLDSGAPAPPETVSQISNNLAQCVERDEQGRPQLKLTLPNDEKPMPSSRLLSAKLMNS